MAAQTAKTHKASRWQDTNREGWVTVPCAAVTVPADRIAKAGEVPTCKTCAKR